MTSVDVGRLAAALSARDRAEFVGLFTPTARALAERLWDNFVALGVTDLSAPAKGRLVVRWAVPGERSVAEEEVTLTFAGSQVSDAVAAGPAAPLWLLQPVAVHSAPGAATLAAEGTAQADLWLPAAGEAAAIVASAGLGEAAASWDGVLVAELPSDISAFAKVAGLTFSTASATQAVTVMATAGSAPRVVGNVGATASLDPIGLRTLLVHEGVHVATRSAISSAPLWAVEGIAESVAAASDEVTRARSLGLVRSSTRPTGLPGDGDLNGSAADTAYALASVAVDAAIARWGRPAFTGWLADWRTTSRPSDADLTSAYLAALP